MNLHHGDCLEVLRTILDCSVDSVVTDPPYGLSFMGKRWDYDVPSVDIWRECLRVLKPGGHLLAFAGTRTQHRMAANIEDAGFEIRDMIAWLHGSGFPKSRNLKGDWEGWGTALKPALEPITVARKPFKGTVAQNVLEHGTGGINIDACRVEAEDLAASQKNWDRVQSQSQGIASTGLKAVDLSDRAPSGRWPTNLIHDGSDEVVELFPAARSSCGGGRSHNAKSGYSGGFAAAYDNSGGQYHDSGSAARFFYCAKASKADREDGNVHPTVKPTDLMAYLCRLVTPTGGIVLDPFMGSGSTIKAALSEGFRAIGIERDPSYYAIAERRLNSAQLGLPMELEP